MKKASDRFATKYVVNPKTECWEWTGARNGNGRAAFSVDGRSVLAHRYSWELFVDPIKEDQEIRRSCNNPVCVNVEHMYVFHKDAETRFWDYVGIDERNGHWYWEGGGPYKYNGTSYSPRNKAWEFYKQTAIKEPYRLFPLCGDDDCISPKHCGNQDDFFWSKVDKSEDGHWYWTGKILKSGYAHVSRFGKNEYIHKVAWELSGKTVDGDNVLFHNCGVKHCVNPLHIEDITYQEMCRRRKPRSK